MAEHRFTLILDGDPEAHMDELFEAGCDDATFGSVDGVAYAEFDREAATLSEAIGSAIRNVESILGLRVLRIEPDDLVTASEIAQRLHAGAGCRGRPLDDAGAILPPSRRSRSEELVGKARRAMEEGLTAV